jgi:D-xylonolactonase
MELPAMHPQVLADYQCVCGEGPLWHPDEKRIYWTDIDTGRMFRLLVATGEHEQCYSGQKVGGFTLQDDGSLLLFRQNGNIAVWKNGQIVKTVIESMPEDEGMRFNDVFADPGGRVFCGTLGPRPGRLYRLDPDGSIRVLLEGVGCANGMGLSPDLKTFYFTDSAKHEIYTFRYDRTTGAITDQQVFATLPKGVYPDGLTVDRDGRVWSANWDGHRVVCYRPDGSVDRILDVPRARKCSSVMFGGEDLMDLYITTAGGDKKQDNGPDAGALLRVRPGVRGVEEFRSRVGL